MGRITEFCHYINRKEKPSRQKMEEEYDYITFYEQVFEDGKKKWKLNKCGEKIEKQRKEQRNDKRTSR